eukprot:TRINITY_DN1847_c0_g1_i2.p1 TRINITY_DN1847_c0_g1~~TRINITY_DN1847_c0_g1_i2.p1  ORF type:complete len:415 (-),score=85.97 TRINITY_DN1847_c0_g1_i2:244-1488(-)
MPLPDKDFDVTETSIPYNYLKLSVPNIEIEFSTENGNVAECDPLLLTGVIFGKLGASEEAKGYYAEMIQSEAFQHPIPYRDLDMERYDAIILPGGHAKGMRQYLESQTLRDKILPFFLRCTEGGDKVCAAICHGTLVLARTIDPTTQKSVLFNLKTTTLPKYMEFNAYMITFWKLGDYYRTYPVYLQGSSGINAEYGGTHTIHNTPLFVVLSLISPKLRFFASFVHYFFPYLLVCTSTSNQPSFTTTTSLLGMSQPAQPNFDGPTPKDKFVQETLEGYSDGDVEFAKTLITSYIGSVEEHLPLLKESFKEPYDKEGAILHSHDIKGSSAYIGAEAVRFLSGKIEFLLRHDKLQEAKTHYDELDKEVKDVFKILEDYMKEHGGSGEEEEEEVPPKEVPKEEKKPERVPAAQAIKG